MNRCVCWCALLLLMPLTGCGGNADKIIGVWSITMVNGKNVPDDEPATMQFTKDGKHIVKIKIAGVEDTAIGDYTVDGNNVTVSGKGADGETRSDIITIVRIDGDMMVLSKNGVEMELKRK